MNEKKNLTTKETFALAVQNHQKNNLKVAENLYNKVLKIDSTHVETNNNLGIIFEKLRQPKKAIRYFQKATQIKPDYADAYYNLGKIFNELNEHQKAISYYEKAIQINSNQADVHNNL